MLKITEVVEKYFKENIAKYVFKVLKKYDIIRNLSYFIIDNIKDNNIIIAVLFLAFCKKFSLKYDSVYYRIRYQGYIINLAIKSFLFVTDKKVLDKNTESNIYNVIVKEIKN